MKVSLFVHDLSGNPIVRAYPIAKAIQLLGHEVEILGLTYNTDKIYEPYRNEFTYKSINSYLDIRWVIINGFKLSRMATGDVVYSFKGVWGTYWPALLYSWFGLKRRLIMDEEDNELWDAFIGNGWKTLRQSKFYPLNPVFNKLLHPFTFLARRKTVVCTGLKKRYGGKIVLHGPDAKTFDPVLYPVQEEIRKKYGMPLISPLLLFAGRPVFYNGLPVLIDALLNDAASKWHLVLAGDPSNELFLKAKKALGDRCHLLGMIPNTHMPEILKMVDIVPVIQTPMPSTEMQIPAKMLEAMSMAKGVIATDVSDIRRIIGPDKGWILEKFNAGELAGLLNQLSTQPEAIMLRGENARRFYLENASTEAIAAKIKSYFG